MVNHPLEEEKRKIRWRTFFLTCSLSIVLTILFINTEEIKSTVKSILCSNSKARQGFKIDGYEFNRAFLMESMNRSAERRGFEIYTGRHSKSLSRMNLQIKPEEVIMDNGIIQVHLSNPTGFVSILQYNGMENLFEVKEKRKGYWDVNWNEPGGDEMYETLEGRDFKVISNDQNKIEVSFTRTWDASLKSISIPLNLEIRYILLSGSSGFYSYAIVEHLEGWPDFYLYQLRMALKLRRDKFNYMALSDKRQRAMPSSEDRAMGQPLAYPEAVLLTNPSNPAFKGEVDDKYMYSTESRDNKVHGWISSDPKVGLWMITPSDEFRSGGPLKQDLTSHVGPTTLAMFISTHYAGPGLGANFSNGEPWKKVFGPVFIYVNSVSNINNPNKALWIDAKKQMKREVQSWPYSFPASQDFPPAQKRGTVTGRLLVDDRNPKQNHTPAAFAHVGLAPQGEAGSWQTESKGYQFWVTTDANGSFSIPHVRDGLYNLYAWVVGFIGDYMYQSTITITPGCFINLGDLVFMPPRDGPTLWEIGIPDRSAEEFYIPNPPPMFKNRLYTTLKKDKFRQYGLWDRYSDLYSNQELVYKVGISDYHKHWLFAQGVRKKRNNTYVGTTWIVIFNLFNVSQTGVYKLRLALAASIFAELQVRVNDPKAIPPHFTTGRIGKDNAIARHGIHGLYSLYTVDIPGSQLIRGNNAIFLTQPRCSTAFDGLMYDYVRLEGPSRL